MKRHKGRIDFWCVADGKLLTQDSDQDGPHPEFLAELPNRGVGPVVIDERFKLPWTATHFSQAFRKIARAAGWPDDLCSMDSRAGAVSNAFEAGADKADAMRTATPTQMSTTMICNRKGVVQSSRVAELRAARRKGREQA